MQNTIVELIFEVQEKYLSLRKLRESGRVNGGEKVFKAVVNQNVRRILQIGQYYIYGANNFRYML